MYPNAIMATSKASAFWTRSQTPKMPPLVRVMKPCPLGLRPVCMTHLFRSPFPVSWIDGMVLIAFTKPGKSSKGTEYTLVVRSSEGSSFAEGVTGKTGVVVRETKGKVKDTKAICLASETSSPEYSFQCQPLCSFTATLALLSSKSDLLELPQMLELRSNRLFSSIWI